MKIMKHHIRPALAIFISILTLTAATHLTAAQKINERELIARHLESIGKPEDRAALKDMTALGTVDFSVLRSGGVGASGNIVLASQKEMSAFGMTFKLPNYPNDTIVFDGRKAKVAFPISNARSPVGDFIYRNNKIVERNVFGGTLLTGWVLSDPQLRRGNVDSENRRRGLSGDFYVLRYFPRGGSDAEIRLFFDPTTFRHVKTEYILLISSLQGSSPEASSQRRGQRQILTEEFGDFREVQGLTLPHSYQIYILYEGESGTSEYEWKAKFTNFLFNQGIDPATFRTN